MLLLVWIVAGLIVWLFERKYNKAMFGQKLVHGLGHGIWWAAVTMTTVGYGDKAPKSMGGRIVAVIWMFMSIILISIFTATVTTNLTVGALSGSVRGFRDLAHVGVGTLHGSQTLEYLTKEGIRAKGYESIEDGLEAVAEKRLDAFVQDVAVVKHLVNKDYFNSLHVLPEVFNGYYVSMAIPEGSNLREPLNRALLKVIEKDQWNDLLNIYLGQGR
jgi:ABC-type amino acid transport substrate-binding protein